MDRMRPADESDASVDKLRSELISVIKDFEPIANLYETYFEQFNQTKYQINAKKTHMSAQCELIEMVKDQIKLNESLRIECQQSDCAILDQHKENMEIHLQNLHDILNRWETQLKQLISQCKQLERETNSITPKLVYLQCLRDGIEHNLLRKGVSKEEISRWKGEETDSYDWDARDESAWLLKDCSRDQAVSLLSSKPNGTFLIRASSAGPYALSIVVDGVVHHCKILCEDNQYGFSHPLGFSDLRGLVHYYQHHSLENHNARLKTCLSRPLNMNSESQVEYSQFLSNS